MMILIIVLLCVLFGLCAYGLMFKTGLLPESPHDVSTPAPGPVAPPAPVPTFGAKPARQRRELPRGCMITLIVGASLWFTAWAIVLVLAVNFLRAPYG